MFKTMQEAIEFVQDTLNDDAIIIHERDYHFKLVNDFGLYAGITLTIANVGLSGYTIEVEITQTQTGKYAVQFDSEGTWQSIF